MQVVWAGRGRSRFWAVLAFLGAAAVSLYGQQVAKTAPARPPADLRVDVSLALIPATVTNPAGETVLGLRREDFHLLEDGVEQKITFLAGEDIPLSVGLVFDLSGSMREKMPKSSQAATGLLRSFDHREDEFFLVEFNERPKLSVPFTQNAGDIEAQLHRARPLGRTALLDAIHLAKTVMRKARNSRKAIVILSDGGDNHSRYTATEIRKEMRESDVQIYAMALRSATEASRLVREEQDGPQLLADVAGETGGRHLDLTSLDDLTGACARIASELHNQYLIGYSPSDSNGQNHRIRILASSPDSMPLKVYHRPRLNAPVR